MERASSLLLTISLFAFLVPGIAEAYTERQKEEVIREANRRSLSDWPSVVFFCDTGESEGQAYLAARKICEAASTEARLVAAQSRVPFRVDPTIGNAMMSSVADGALVLEQTVIQTQDGLAPGAIFISLKAWAYSPKTTFEVRDPADGLTVLREHERTGALLLWEQRTAIGASEDTPDSLVDQMSDLSETLIKQFFAQYLEANTGPGN